MKLVRWNPPESKDIPPGHLAVPVTGVPLCGPTGPGGGEPSGTTGSGASGASGANSVLRIVASGVNTSGAQTTCIVTLRDGVENSLSLSTVSSVTGL